MMVVLHSVRPIGGCTILDTGYSILDAGQIMDDLIPISRLESGVFIVEGRVNPGWMEDHILQSAVGTTRLRPPQANKRE